jgi:hypothetical protein
VPLTVETTVLPSSARQRDSCKLGGSSSRMTHFSAAKRRFCEHAGLWGADGAVAERLSLGSSRRLTLQKDEARQRDSCKLGGFIVSYDPFFSREAAFLRARGVVGSGRRDSGATQSWVKPEVDPPKVTALPRDSCKLGGSSSRMTHFSAAKRRFCGRAGLWGADGAVAERFNLGSSRRLTLQKDEALPRDCHAGLLSSPCPNF